MPRRFLPLIYDLGRKFSAPSQQQFPRLNFAHSIPHPCLFVLLNHLRSIFWLWRRSSFSVSRGCLRLVSHLSLSLPLLLSLVMISFPVFILSLVLSAEIHVEEWRMSDTISFIDKVLSLLLKNLIFSLCLSWL